MIVFFISSGILLIVLGAILIFNSISEHVNEQITYRDYPDIDYSETKKDKDDYNYPENYLEELNKELNDT